MGLHRDKRTHGLCTPKEENVRNNALNFQEPEYMDNDYNDYMYIDLGCMWEGGVNVNANIVCV